MSKFIGIILFLSQYLSVAGQNLISSIECLLKSESYSVQLREDNILEIWEYRPSCSVQYYIRICQLASITDDGDYNRENPVLAFICEDDAKCISSFSNCPYEKANRPRSSVYLIIANDHCRGQSIRQSFIQFRRNCGS